MTLNNPNDAVDITLRSTQEDPDTTLAEHHETVCETLDRLDEILEDTNV